MKKNMQHSSRTSEQLEAALQSPRKLNVSAVIKEAWAITLAKGKADILAGYALAWICSFVLVTLLAPVVGSNVSWQESDLPAEFVQQLQTPTDSSTGVADINGDIQPATDGQQGISAGEILSLGIANLLVFMLLAPIHLGVEMIGVSNVLGRTRSYKQAFGYLAFTLPLILLSITIAILVFFGLNLFFIPGVYLAVGTSLASIVLVEYRLNAGRALVCSIRAVHRNWFSVASALALAYFLTILPTLMALTGGYLNPLTLLALAAQFWFIPLLYNVKGVLYRELFGADDNLADQSSDSGTRIPTESDVFNA